MPKPQSNKFAAPKPEKRANNMQATLKAQGRKQYEGQTKAPKKVVTYTKQDRKVAAVYVPPPRKYNTPGASANF